MNAHADEDEGVGSKDEEEMMLLHNNRGIGGGGGSSRCRVLLNPTFASHGPAGYYCTVCTAYDAPAVCPGTATRAAFVPPANTAHPALSRNSCSVANDLHPPCAAQWPQSPSLP